jgi:ribonuclease HII
MKYPNFYFERKLWNNNYLRIAGLDEVGRGSFVGPLVAGCVVFNRNTSLKFIKNAEIKINDSKKLTPKQREESSKWIKKNVLSWGIGKADVSEINRLGVGKATLSAFRRALTSANNRFNRIIIYSLMLIIYRMSALNAI